MLTGNIRKSNHLVGNLSGGSGGGGTNIRDYVPLIVDIDDFDVLDPSTVVGEIMQAPPMTFNAKQNGLISATIYGSDGGVGDLNETTGKYDIPVTLTATGHTSTKTYSVDSPLLSGVGLVINDNLPATVSGSNTLSVGTTVQPEFVYIKYNDLRG